MLQKAQKTYDEVKEINLEPIISRYARTYNCNYEEAEKLMSELKKWLVLCATNKENTYQLIGPVDKMWHIFLLFTYEYSEFCKTIGGFIHHIPTSSKELKEARLDDVKLNILNDKIENGYNLFLNDYENVFNEKPLSSFWPNYFNPFTRDDSDGGGCGVGCGCNGAHPL